MSRLSRRGRKSLRVVSVDSPLGIQKRQELLAAIEALPPFERGLVMKQLEGEYVQSRVAPPVRMMPAEKPRATGTISLIGSDGETVVF